MTQTISPAPQVPSGQRDTQSAESAPTAGLLERLLTDHQEHDARNTR